MSSISITIDGQDYAIDDSRPLNVIEAAGQVGIEIPTYCWHPGLSVVASCRMCLVEAGSRTAEGEVRMGRKLEPACQLPARDGTVIVTESEKVKENRRAVEEYLLLDHPLDCPICDRAGECRLQDYYFDHGRSERRDLPQPFTSRRKDLGHEVTFFVDRCVMCSCCVRFTREISGTGELQVVDRGNKSEIDIFPGFPIDNKLSGNVVDLCPVGALCSRDFLYEQRVWYLDGHDSVCTGCSTGCSIRVEENRGTVYRIKPRHNPAVNDWWICDDGRLGYHYVGSPERLQQPRQRFGDEYRDAEWSELIESLRGDLQAAAKADGGGSLAVVLSPMLTCEEAWLLATFAKSLGPSVRLVLGQVPVVGEDDVFPKNARGGDTTTPRFTIRAEKCPNRRGVEEIIRGLGDEVVGLETVFEQIAAGAVRSLFLTGGYPQEWLDAELAQALGTLELSALVDILPSAAATQVGYLLPGAAWAEKPGSYVNHAGLLQVTHRAVNPPGEARSEGRIFWDLAGRHRLYHAGDVLEEMAEQLTFFGPCAKGGVGELGVMLEVENSPAS